MLFFIVVFSVLGLLHAFLYVQLAAAWPAGAWVVAVIITVLLLMPFLMILSRHRGWHGATRVFARIGFTWLGVLFLADCVLAALKLLGLVGAWIGWSPISAEMTVGLAGAITVTGVLYGCFEARRPRLQSIRLTRKPFNGRDPLRLVQLSDLHLGYVAKRERLLELVERVHALKPDVIVSTGDLFDGDYARMEPFVDLLADLRAPLGKFAISGNHEVYEGLEAGLALTQQAGFRVLRGEAVSVSPELTVVGVDDAEALPSGTAAAHEAAALEAASSAIVVLLLKHRPTVLGSSLGKFDLQLSGHTHGGQIFPFNFLTRLVFRYGPGLHALPKDSALYVSRGTGTWGPQFRIFAPPEITLIELAGN